MFKMIPLNNKNNYKANRIAIKELKKFEIQTEPSKRDCHEPEEEPTVKDPEKSSVFKPGCVPQGMDVFWSDWRTFLPEGKDPEDLTPEEKKKLSHQYRYSPLRPGIYQGITGINNGFRGNRGNMYT